jgi:hypothetical protein
MDQNIIEKFLDLYIQLQHAKNCFATNCVYNCLVWKSLLEHVNTCRNHDNCEYQKCMNSKSLIRHTRFCTQNTCSFCVELNKVKLKLFEQRIKKLEEVSSFLSYLDESDLNSLNNFNF